MTAPLPPTSTPPAEKVESGPTPAKPPATGLATELQNQLAAAQKAPGTPGASLEATALGGATGQVQIPNPQSLFADAMGLGSLKPGVPGPRSDAPPKPAPTGDTSLGAAVASVDAPVRAADAPPQNDIGDRQQQVTTLLAGDSSLKAQVDELRGHLSTLPEASRSQAEADLDAMLLRGTAGYTASRSGTGATEDQKAELARNPALTPEQLTQTLASLNAAMRAGVNELSPLMGSGTPQLQANGRSESEREINRDLVVAQALRNFGDTRGVQQYDHQTCLLDSKIADEARHSPQVAAANLMKAMTSTDGHVKLQDGTDVKLDSSWMTPDNEARASVGGAQAVGMSADVRMLTGLYANALTQHRTNGPNQMFTMSADRFGAIDNADSGDRLVDMNTGREQILGNGRYADSPIVDGADSIALSRMTGDGSLLVANAAAFHFSAADSANFQNVSSAQQLAALVRDHGSVLVGLNANILFDGHAIGNSAGGHATSITEVRTGADGRPEFHVQDTNAGLNAWYSADRIMAAINNDHRYNSPSGQQLDQPGQRGATIPDVPGPRGRGGEQPGPGGARVDSEPVAHPRGVLTPQEQHQQLHDLRPETNAEEKTRKDLEHVHQQEDKLRKDQQKAGTALERDEERARREQEKKLLHEEAALKATLAKEERERRRKEEEEERRRAAQGNR